MKSKIYIIALLVLLVSCEDFMQEYSQDLVVPESVQDYNELLYGEAYMHWNDNLHAYLDIMTDDITNYTSTSSWGTDHREKGYGYFAWQSDPELGLSGDRHLDDAWEWYYHSILICNIVLTDVADFKQESPEKEDLLAEAHFIRAWCYFTLVNLYGEPYEQASATSAKGVPINTVTGSEDILIPRSTVAENYELIEKDLEKAIERFKTSQLPKDHYRANLTAAYLLASRVALFQKKFDKAIEYSNQALLKKSGLYDLNNFEPYTRFIDATRNPEIIFTYGDYYNPFFSRYGRASFPASDQLVAMFQSEDIRPDVFIKYGHPNKTDSPGDSKVFGYAMRTAELYLNRAEAYAENGEIGKAMDDINTIREKRFTENFQVSASTKEEAIEIVRTERRLELCFEQHRWFDLRRWDRPELVHVLMKDPANDITETYVLQKDDPAYTLPVPFAVTEYDKEIDNIERPDRPPLN